MATDIVLDDKSGDCITLTCAEVATSAFDVTVDNPDSRKSSGGTRRAFRHDKGDGLSINPERDYPAGVSIQQTSLNLKVNEQKGATPKLPKRAQMGDLFLVHTRNVIPAHSDMHEMLVETCTLWLCTGRAPGGGANWAPVTLGSPVAGTI